MSQQSASQRNAYHQEWAYVQGRKFLLFLLALGSLLVTFRIGGYLGQLLMPDYRPAHLFFKVAFVLLGYVGIDWVLANALASASMVTETSHDSNTPPLPVPRMVWFFAIAALLTTIGLSVASNLFISAEMAGESHLDQFQHTLTGAMRNDSLMKQKAFHLLANTTTEQRYRIEQAKIAQKRLLQAAIVRGSASWQRDYERHKHNRTAWFWTCRRCPRSYRAYRDTIQAAIDQGHRLVQQAQQYTERMQATLSPTLSYQLSTDSMLLTVRHHTALQEAERQKRERQLNRILLVLTAGAGLLSFILTIVLKDHRLRYGQQVIENHIRPIMLALDMIDRLGDAIVDLIYTIIALPFLYLKRKGVIRSYRYRVKRETTLPHAIVTSTDPQRICLTCHTDISHKRSDAKFCSDACRMKYHNFVPGKQRRNRSLSS